MLWYILEVFLFFNFFKKNLLAVDNVKECEHCIIRQYHVKTYSNPGSHEHKFSNADPLCVLQGAMFHQLSPQSQKIAERLKNLEQEVSGGATAVVALILNNKLYIANVGTYTHTYIDSVCLTHRKSTL